MDLPPEADWPALRPADYAYRHVTVSGRFEHDREVHVFRPLGDAKGPFHGVGDLVADHRPHLLLVPAERIDPATRAAGQIEGPVTVTGLMREPESRNLFTPADDPAKAQWFTRDPAAIAAAEHLERAAPFTIDADASAVPGGLPQGGETVLDVPNNHLSYAFTWFGLALGLLGVFAVYAARRVRAVPGSAAPE